MAKGSEGIKGHEHSASPAHKGSAHGHDAHSSHHDSEFLTQVRALKEAEKSAATRVEDARGDAAEIEASAREQAVEILGKASQKAVEAKNDILAKKRAEAEAEVDEILGVAKKQANAIRAKRLSETDVAEISQDI